MNEANHEAVCTPRTVAIVRDGDVSPRISGHLDDLPRQMNQHARVGMKPHGPPRDAAINERDPAIRHCEFREGKALELRFTREQCGEIDAMTIPAGPSTHKAHATITSANAGYRGLPVTLPMNGLPGAFVLSTMIYHVVLRVPRRARAPPNRGREPAPPPGRMARCIEIARKKRCGFRQKAPGKDRTRNAIFSAGKRNRP